MIRHGWAVASPQPAPEAQKATVQPLLSNMTPPITGDDPPRLGRGITTTGSRGTKSNGATVAEQYDTADNWG